MKRLLDGTKILSETHTYSDNSNESYTLNFIYDESGSVTGFKKDGATYFYQKNLQGDVIRIVSVIGVTFVEYTYDAWGNILSITGDQADTLGQLNPFRYRSYYYDSETGFYYLNSRYYDPEVKRFINADGILGDSSTVVGYNMFSYCSNNPVVRYDSGGQFWDTLFDVVSLVASVVDVVENPEDPMAWIGLAGDAIDLIPFVTGVGEVVDAVDAVHDTYKAIDNIMDTADTINDTIKTSDNIGDAVYLTRKYTSGSPNKIGQIGEQLAGIDPKQKITININGRNRIPDELTSDHLREVKNVKYVSNTQQLRDFADYADSKQIEKILCIRPNGLTKVSKSVIDAGWKIQYLW